MSWILIPASAIFLSTYGADLLPVTYIGAAVGGRGVERRPVAAFRRRPLGDGGGAGAGRRRVALVVAWLLLERRALAVLRPARARAHRGADGLHAPRGPGGDAARRPGPQGALRAGHRRVRLGLRRRRAGRAARSSACSAAPSTSSLGAARRPALWLGLLMLTRRQFPTSCRRSSTTSVDPGTRPAGAPAAGPLRRADRRLPDAVGGGEPVARLPGVRAGRRAVRGQPGAGPVHQPVHRHRLRRRHRVPAPDRRPAAAPVRAALRAHRQPGVVLGLVAGSWRCRRSRGRGRRWCSCSSSRLGSPTSCSPTAPPAPR